MSYNYTNFPKASVRERSPIHDGAAILKVIDEPEENYLKVSTGRAEKQPATYAWSFSPKSYSRRTRNLGAIFEEVGDDDVLLLDGVDPERDRYE